jgi:4'-phosphopantetheinyl transferase
VPVDPSDSFWQAPGSLIRPLGGDMHVWRIVLDRSDAIIARLKSILSDDERARAARFYAQRDRERFIIGRGSLRTILGRYLGVAPDHLDFAAGPHGKPGLIGEHRGLEFNLTHSQGLAVLALATGRRLGVDIESVRPVREMEGMVVRFFSPFEREAFQAVPPDRRLDAFFRAWTRKEAYIKAIGTGLATSLDSFDVGVDPASPPGLIEVRQGGEAADVWTMLDFDPGQGFFGSLVVEGPIVQLLGFDENFDGFGSTP